MRVGMCSGSSTAMTPTARSLARGMSARPWPPPEASRSTSRWSSSDRPSTGSWTSRRRRGGRTSLRPFSAVDERPKLRERLPGPACGRRHDPRPHPDAPREAVRHRRGRRRDPTRRARDHERPPESPVTLALHAEAVEDLRKSGLSDATITAAGLYTPSPGDLPLLLSPRFVDKVRHVLVFPYDGASQAIPILRPGEFVRCKLFPPVTDNQGHTIRYYQRAGTPPRLYIPADVRASLPDPTRPLLITEGEKKALKANQEGLATIAVGGLWNWQANGRAIADLSRIDWVERETVIVPDSDVWTRLELVQPAFALDKELESRGAKVMVLKLPPARDGAKAGIDDYLCAHPRERLEALPRFPLKHAALSRASAWWRGWAKRKEEASDTAAEATALDLLERAESVRVLHPAQDVLDGVLWYGVPVDGALVSITSMRQAYRADRLPQGIALRHTDPGTSTVSRDVAVLWLTAGESGSVVRVVDALDAFFLRYVVLPDRRAALWIAAWTLGTWCYRAFRVFPYLSIRSSEKRCGKSRLLGLLARVCFNASTVTAHPTGAPVYRLAARAGCAQH